LVATGYEGYHAMEVVRPPGMGSAVLDKRLSW
jgi:hypothetical protein